MKNIVVLFLLSILLLHFQIAPLFKKSYLVK